MYEAGKLGEGRWGIFYRLDEHTSFGPKATFKTKREATRTASEWNWAERELAKERAS